MEPYTTEQLNGAVEWLKRARQSAKTFPAPKECIKAIMAVEEALPARSSSRPTFQSGMTYGAKLHEWHARVGGKRYPVIVKGSHEWTEWEIYFLATGNTVQYPVMQSKDRWTVPTQVPSQFDDRYDWQKGDRLLRERVEFEKLSDTPSRHKFVQEQLKRVRFG